MNARTLQLLEYPKVLRHLAHFAVSEAGQAACLALLPERDPERIASRTALVREMIRLSAYAELRLPVFPDVAGVFEFLRNPMACLDADGFVGLREMFLAAVSAQKCLEQADDACPNLLTLATALAPPVQIWSGLRRCLAAEGLLRDEASPELFLVRQEIRRLHQMCTRKVQDFMTHKDLALVLRDEFLTISSDRYVLALKADFKGRMKGIVHDYSQTGETCYFEPFFLVELNNTLQEFRQEERVEEQKIFAFLTSLVRAEQAAVNEAFAALVQVDQLLAIARFAKRTDAQVIDIALDAPLHLEQARHPLLIFGSEQAVPVDIILQAHQRALIISGGNAGGKTVCLKTLGLLGLMAHAGLPIPVAEGGSMPLWTKVVVSMGDEQSIEENLSTFTAQIRHLRTVWPEIDAQTLVILDEFGIGTDPSQGAALAQAVVDALLERRAFVGVATHFPALKAYGLSRDDVRAASVIFSPDTNKPLFRLGYDQVGGSRALAVAREQGLPQTILDRAQEYLLLDTAETQPFFDRLNALAVAKEEEVDHLRRRSQELEEKFAARLAKLEQERTRTLAQIRTSSQEIMRQWREGRRGRNEALQDLARLKQEAGSNASVPVTEQKPDLQTIAQGQVLLYVPWNKTGLVQYVDQKRARVRLEMGGVSLWADAADLRPDTPGKSVKNGVVITNTTAASPLRLDLRGLRVDEAEAELSRFLDKSLLTNRSEVEIIHGKGTGSMRRLVHEHLRTSNAVDTFHAANADEGGDGVTRVVLAG